MNPEIKLPTCALEDALRLLRSASFGASFAAGCNPATTDREYSIIAVGAVLRQLQQQLSELSDLASQSAASFELAAYGARGERQKLLKK